MTWRGLTVWELADIIFGEIFTEDFLKEYEREIAGSKLTVKERFIAHFETRFFTPKYSRKISEIVAKELIENHVLNQKNFLNYTIKSNGAVNFSFEIFSPLFRPMNQQEKAHRGFYLGLPITPHP